jgi:hypothetical protein
MRKTSTLACALAAALGATAAACKSIAPDDTPTTARAPIAPERSGAIATAIAADGGNARTPEGEPAADDAPLAWGTRPPKEGVLFPIVDGMCIHGDVYRLQNAVLFAYGSSRGAYSRGGATTTALVTDAGLEPQPNVGFGATFDFWGVTAMGGHYPDRLWAIVDTSSRMIEASDLRVGTAKAEDWKVAIASGAKWGDAGNAAAVAVPVRSFGKPLALADGTVLVPERTSLCKNDTWTLSHAFRAISADGTLVAKPKVPGADLAEVAMGPSPNVVALANGEVLGLRYNPGLKLVRWSPSKPVDDLPLPAARTGAKIAAGPTRAYVQVEAQLFVYDGDKLSAVKLTPRLVKGFSWAVGAGDTLYVALPSENKLLVETAQGAITEEPMPAFGNLHASPASATVWLVSDNQRHIHRRTTKGWEPVVLPAPPFGNALRGPPTIESLQIFGADDVFVNARRFEKGWGWSTPEPYRVLYRTKRPAQVLRCQDVRNEGTGRGLYAWPPAAEDACTTPFVVVMREETPAPAPTYPNIASRLRGKTEYGDKLPFVSFSGRGGLNLGIPMSDTEKARKLATYLSKSLDLRADVVCGRPDAASVARQLDFDVEKGAFSTATASPAR